ncbi:MAG TPA: hypothetical protein VJ788_03485 [Gemmatimonadota bacterium]|nr:hypothetical protein [Gemmatimonadota bacterium]
MTNDYTPTERLGLWALGAIGLFGINGVFVWAMLTRPEAISETLANPLALAFMAEAMILVATLAWLFRKWGLTRLPWGLFVALSLIGSLAFAISIALLLPRRHGDEQPLTLPG